MKLNKERKSQVNEYLQKKLGMYDYRRGWLKGDCPSCGEHKYGVNISQDRSNCFKCGYNPRPLNLILEVEKMDTLSEVHSLLNNLAGITFTEVEVEAMELKKDNVLPEGYVNIKRGKSLLARSARAWAKRRGFDVKELSQAGWGYGTDGKYFGYIIMPYYYNNLLVYFNARLYLGNGPKFNNPEVEDFGLGKSFIIYNRDALYIYDKVFIVESVTNSRTIGDNAIGTGGKKLSAYQINEIIKSPCKKVVIGLDRDAIMDAISLAYRLIEYKKVKILIPPIDKDINDIGRKNTMILSSKSKYLNHRTLRELKNKFLNEEGNI